MHACKNAISLHIVMIIFASFFIMVYFNAIISYQNIDGTDSISSIYISIHHDLLQHIYIYIRVILVKLTWYA